MNTISRFFLQPWLYVVIVIVGTLLKFYHLNNKLFWSDETSTVLYVSGVKDHFIINSIPVNQTKSISYYDSLLHHSTKPYSITNQVAGILSDTHLTPAHYIFLTLWYRLIGNDDTGLSFVFRFRFYPLTALSFFVGKNLI